MNFKLVANELDRAFYIADEHGFAVATPITTFNFSKANWSNKKLPPKQLWESITTEGDRARINALLGKDDPEILTITPMGSLLNILRLANQAFHAIPESDQQRIIDWASQHPHSQGGGFDVSQLISAAQYDLQSIINEDDQRLAMTQGVSATEFAKTNSVDADWVQHMEAAGRRVVVLEPGQKGMCNGYPATVLHHYHNGMYEVRLASGVTCVDALRFTPLPQADQERCKAGTKSVIRALSTTAELRGTEYFPGANIEEIGSVMMQEIIGDYEVPDGIPEWAWVEDKASFAHQRNGEPGGVWEFVLNLSNELTGVPDSLRPVLVEARAKHLSYLIFHQGT